MSTNKEIDTDWKKIISSVPYQNLIIKKDGKEYKLIPIKKSDNYFWVGFVLGVIITLLIDTIWWVITFAKC